MIEKRDLRYTPLSAFRPLLPYLPCVGTVHDPCQGDGRLVKWMKEFVAIDATGSDINIGDNYLNDPINRECIVTNPPYSCWQSVVNHANEFSKESFMLLNLRYLGAQSRRRWWQQCEPMALFILSERPRFDQYNPETKVIRIERCTDNAEYAWFYWGTRWNGIKHL